MSNTLQYVADRIALADVILQYAKGVDERDFDLYRGVLADDVEVVGFGPNTFFGADAWSNFCKQELRQYAASQHMLGPQLATIDGDTAHCRTDVQALHYLKSEASTTLMLWATYVADMQRIDGRWKIKRLELISRGVRVQSG